MIGVVINIKDSYIAVKRCESIVLLKLKEIADIQLGEILKGNMKSPGEATLQRVEYEEKIEVVILFPICSIEKLNEYIN